MEKNLKSCGCFAALTSILRYGGCSIEDVLSALEKEHQLIRGVSKSETRALDTGHLLTCGAVIHSGLFTQQSVPVQQSILEKLFHLGKKKSYFFPLACCFIVDYVNSVDEQQFKEHVWEICETQLFNELDLNEWSIDCYYLLVICWNKNSAVLKKFIKKKFGTFDTLLENLIKNIFTKSVRSTHSIFNCMGAILCSNDESLKKIWINIIENHGKSYVLKDNVLIILFWNIIKHLKDVKVIPDLLAPKFVGVLIKVLSYRKSVSYRDDCYAMAKDSLSLVVDVLKNNESSETKLNVIKSLIFYPSNLKFEAKTGLKIVRSIILQLNSNQIKELFDIYESIIRDDLKKTINDAGNTENWSIKEKQIALNNIVKTINHSSIKNDTNLKLQQIKFIFEIGFLIKNENIIELKKYASEIFYKAIMLQTQSLKDLVFLLDELVEYVNKQIENKNLDVSEEVLHWWQKQYSVVQKLKNKSKNKSYIAVHILLIYMGFQLFSDSKLAISGIDELLSCYSNLKSVHKKKAKDAIHENGHDSEKVVDLHWTEVTVDLILSLLSRENKLWRRVISYVFPQVVVHATSTALNQIIDVLNPNFQESVLESAVSDDSEAESSSDESESDISYSDENFEKEEENDDEDKPNDQLRCAVREALGYSAAGTDDESIDMDDMNEEEEAQLNEKLSAAFKLWKAGSQEKKKKQTKEEEALMHFRLRVLDLVEMYISTNQTMRGCLDLIHPLFNLLEYSIKNKYQTPLKNRVDSILNSVSSSKRSFIDKEHVTQSDIYEIFNLILDKREISSLVFVEMAPRVTDSVAFLIRCSQILNENEPYEPLVNKFKSLLESFFLSRDFKLPITMFQAVIKMSWKVFTIF
ncbi:DNA polymerase V, putative [Pediculus humanus corporis]|uniref:DNA polymerase V, putative n=1 Tax=Pediculus humanus subsp. corporis TaxID=121224 RepID=E0VQC6_PEDHC|nr:DNA polymerase V, putative [Pediculus humanus corporis]EEB15582.1 DNA polymerase V, putative [Pediculus humanus corporis]